MFDPIRLRGVYANRAALELWGAASGEELLARDYSNLSPAVLARTARLARETADGADICEQWTFYPKGVPVTVQATISTWRLEDGHTVLLFEASPAEVQPGERRAIEALRHTTTLVSLFDSAGAPLFANPAVFAAYGAVDGAYVDRFPERERALDLFARAAAGEPVGDVIAVDTPDGPRWRQIDLRRVIDPVTGSPGVILNEIDVTERVEAEAARAAAEQKVAMAEAREAFLSDMSHELRTPLNAVLGFSELIARAPGSAETADRAARIAAAGAELAAVVEQMIGISAGHDPAPLAAHEPEPDARDASSAPSERPLRVLYVDDNDSNRALVKAVLATQAIACETADDGAEGVERAKEGGWDLILMDIQMPVMDGVSATRAIRELDGPAAAVPIIALTANTLPEQLDLYAAAGMDDAIAKPLSVPLLLSKLGAWSNTASVDARPLDHGCAAAA